MSSVGHDLYRKARRLIPGGTQLLSKRPELFAPDVWPPYYRSARGAELTDLDGNTFTDMSYSGIGSCILGYADPDVDAAVQSAIRTGGMSTLNCAEEVELAEELLSIHPWADRVRYARTGGEAMAMAVRIARASTGKDNVAFCGYHGWHDWYLAANLAGDGLDGHLMPGLDPAGVPRGLEGTARPFHYNNLDELRELMETANIGVVAMEPARDRHPEPGFLEGVRALCDEHDAVLIIDEITAGFRLNHGGLHMLYGVEPDIAVFAKGMSNGYAMAAIVGRESVMEAAQATFISSTYWTERIGPTAALATIRKHRRERVHEHLVQLGQDVKTIWQEAAEAQNLPIHVSGLDPLAHFSFEHEESIQMETLFTQKMLARGFLANGSFYANHAHGQSHLEQYATAVESTFGDIQDTLKRGTLAETVGTPRQPGFKRLT